MHGAPHAESGGKKEKSGHGRSCEIVLAVGLKTGGIGWPGPYLQVAAAAAAAGAGAGARLGARVGVEAQEGLEAKAGLGEGWRLEAGGGRQGGVGRAARYMRCMCAASRGISMMG